MKMVNSTGDIKSQVQCFITTEGGGGSEHISLSYKYNYTHAFHFFNNSGHPTIVSLSE